MPKEKEPTEPNINELNVSGADLLKVIALLQKGNADVLAEALAKLQPGYKSPEQVQFAEDQRGQMRQQQVNILRSRKRQQKACEHEVGQTGRHRNGEGAFCCLKLPTGEMIGVCQYCQMVISSANPEHSKFFRKANGTPAQAGQTEGIADPIKAQLARLSPDQRERVLEARRKYFTTVIDAEVEEEDELV